MTRNTTSLATGRNASRRPKTAAKRDNSVLDVTVILLEAGYASTAIGPIEVFHSSGVLWNALRGETTAPRFSVRLASIDGSSVTSRSELGLTPHCAIDDIRKADIIILPASGLEVQETIARNTSLLPWLRQWHKRGAYIAGICSGAAYLAEAGLLDGREATTHWAVADAFRKRYPKVRWRPELFVTEDNRILCSGGVYSSIDLSLYLVEKFCGHKIALQCSQALLVSMPRSRQSGYAAVPISRPHSDDKICDAEDYLRIHFADGVSIDDLAQRAGMSSRNFIRRFKAATGRLPRDYIQILRISEARNLLEQRVASIQTVCARVGYDDIAFFRNIFKRHTAMTPTEYRSKFGQFNFDGIALPTENSSAEAAE